MRELPETFTSIRAKMNGNVKFAIDNMNDALKAMCEDIDTSPKEKLKATQDYLALFMKLENEVHKEKENREITKQRKLNTKIKEYELDKLSGESEEANGMPNAVMQAKFSPTMTRN